MDRQMLAFLHAHGITSKPETLIKMLVDVIEQRPSAVYLRNTRHELSKVESKELREGGFNLAPRRHGSKDPIARYTVRYTEMLATSKSVKEAAGLLGVDPSRVRQRLGKRSLYGMKEGSKWRLPVFQFHNGKLVPGIEKVFAALHSSLNPVSVFSWFMAENPDLEASAKENSGLIQRFSPRDWLLMGNSPDKVVELAEAL